MGEDKDFKKIKEEDIDYTCPVVVNCTRSEKVVLTTVKCQYKRLLEHLKKMLK